MNKFFAYATALSLMFVACSDESSANASGQEPAPASQNTAVANGGAVNSAVANDDVANSDAVMTAIANGGVGKTHHCSTNNANAGKAYLTNTENVGYQIVLPDAHVDKGFDNDEVQIGRVGDTLRILPDSGLIIRLDWICYAYYTFNIPATVADVKYFKFDGTVYDVVPGPAPEKAPDTLCHLTRAEDKVYAEDVYDTSCTICTYSRSASGIYGTDCTDFPHDVYRLPRRESLLYLKP